MLRQTKPLNIGTRRADICLRSPAVQIRNHSNVFYPLFMLKTAADTEPPCSGDILKSSASPCVKFRVFGFDYDIQLIIYCGTRWELDETPGPGVCLCQGVCVCVCLESSHFLVIAGLVVAKWGSRRLVN